MHPRWLASLTVAAGLALVPAAAAGASTTTTTAPKTTTTMVATVHHDEVISGTFVHRANAVKHLDAIRKDGIRGLSVVKIGTKTVRYRVEERGLTRTEARDLVARLHRHGFSAHYVVEG